MSLRDALRSAVARCTPLEMQHATSGGIDATGGATAVQPLPANPHGIREDAATAGATSLQLTAGSHATAVGKLQVARPSECNTQPGPLLLPRITAELLTAAMRACDRHADSETAREQMRAECLATPPALRADLLAHFETTYPQETP